MVQFNDWCDSADMRREMCWRRSHEMTIRQKCNSGLPIELERTGVSDYTALEFPRHLS